MPDGIASLAALCRSSDVSASHVKPQTTRSLVSFAGQWQQALEVPRGNGLISLHINLPELRYTTRRGAEYFSLRTRGPSRIAWLHAPDRWSQQIHRSAASGGIARLYSTCRGAVVVAFERTRILTGLDKPGSSVPKEIKNESHPTVWNHMEAAMAYARKMPLLILVQPGLKRQGMLSDRLEWMAIEVALTPGISSNRTF
jgi:hypothetical protein